MVQSLGLGLEFLGFRAWGFGSQALRIKVQGHEMRRPEPGGQQLLKVPARFGGPQTLNL